MADGAGEQDAEQQATVRSAESAEDLFENAPCGYLSAYADGRLARVNQTFLSWTGYARDELVERRRLVDLLTPGSRIYHETHVGPLLLMQGAVKAIAMDLVRADGSRLPVLVNSHLITDDAGTAIGVRTSVFDASDRREYERELLAARRRAEEATAWVTAVATTLQQSMLPSYLPEDPRLGLSACYRPADDGLQVGGDWYDAFFLGHDRIALVVGDVVGRGLHAAAAMGQLRSAVRALAAVDSGPALLLTRLDSFVEGVPAAQTATLAYAEVDLRDGSVVYACAGHPPPVLVDAAGTATQLWGGRSTPLGAHFGMRDRSEATTVLQPGSRLALYTDGLVELRDTPLDESIDSLARVLSGFASRPLLGLAEAVADAVVGPGPTGDDVCLLTVAATPAAAVSEVASPPDL